MKDSHLPDLKSTENVSGKSVCPVLPYIKGLLAYYIIT